MPIAKEKQTKNIKEIYNADPANAIPFPSDEELLEILARSPFFKRKHQQAQETLSKIDWSQVLEKPSK
jgi:hypothetical protein